MCVHILSLVHVVSLDICEVKIVAQACIQKISELPTGIEPVSPDCRFGYFTTRLYRTGNRETRVRFPLGVQIFSEYKLEQQSLLHIYPSLQHVLDLVYEHMISRIYMML